MRVFLGERLGKTRFYGETSALEIEGKPLFKEPDDLAILHSQFWPFQSRNIPR